MGEQEHTVEKLMQELRRGTLVIAVLSQLKEKQYGYSLVQSLNEKGLRIEQNTLYPLLRRLESQNLLISEWDVDDARPRKYYQLSKVGEQTLALLTEEWHDTVAVMKNLMDNKEGNA